MATLNFSNPSISFSDAGLAGDKTLYPTALEFARSGEPVLFVTQQDGTIWRYVVEKGADGFLVSKAGTPSQTAAAALKIDAIKTGTTNYNDDGRLGPQDVRQVTGLTVREEVIDGVARDVLYVTSSDHRIGGGDGAADYNIDTNSSQLHKLVLDQASGAVISSVALVRGLPRSPENHSANGLDLATDPATGDTILFVAQGAHTNKGAPSNNMVGIADTALTGTILRINLTDLSRYDVRTDGMGERFVLDLPTLNDPGRADVDLSKLKIGNLEADPNFALDDNGVGANGKLLPDWAGGALGFNQAKITSHVLVSEGGQLKLVANPMTVMQPGHRNPYDVLVTEGGEVVTWDNGPNGGWGGEPMSFGDGKIVDDWRSDLATNDFNESGSTAYWDQLHVVGTVGDRHGPYAGFPNAIRAAKEVLDRAFSKDGQYLGKTSSTPILDEDGTLIFRDEAEARDYLARLLPIYRRVDGTWVDVRPLDADGNPVVPEDLHDVVSGYRWAHPGASITDPKGHFKGASVMDGTTFSPEGQHMPWGQDGGLILGSGSTNGLAQYTAGGWFGGALDGALLATGFGGGKLLFTKLVDTDGDGRTDKAVSLGTIAGFGSKPLAVTALGDKGLGRFIDEDGDGIDDFSGVIFAATYGDDAITTFVPGGTPSTPSTDQDGDEVNDSLDTHVGDPLDGRGVVAGDAPVRWHFVLSDPKATPPGAVTTSGPAGGMGLTAAWGNGEDAGVDGGLYDDANFDLGGASTFVSSEEAHTGSPNGATNSLRNVLGVGATLSKNLESATITTEMVNVFDYVLNQDQKKTWTGGEEVGLVLGPDQSDFVRAVIVMRDNGTTGLRIYAEGDDVKLDNAFKLMPGLATPATAANQSSVVQMGFVLDLTPGQETVSARARYQNPDLDDAIGADAPWSEWFKTDAIPLPPAVLQSLHGEHGHFGRETGAVIGLYSKADPGDDSFAASWDWVEIDGTPRESSGEEQVVYRWNAAKDGGTVKATDGGPDWIATKAAVAAGSTDKFGAWNLQGRDASVPDHVPQAIFAQERWDAPAGSDLTLSFGQSVLGAPLADGEYAVRVFLSNGYAGTSQPGQRAFDVAVEGQTLADEFDAAKAWGHAVGGMLEWTGRVSDGAVDIAFGREVENPQVNGVEIVRLGAAPTGPVVSVLGATLPEAAGETGTTIQTSVPVPVGKTVTVGWAVRALDGGATPGVDYEVAGATLDGAGNYVGSGSIAGGSSDLTIPIVVLNDGAVEGPEAFEVVLTSVSGAGATVGKGTATVSIADDDEAQATGDALFRVNAGGTKTAVEGLDWGADTKAAPSPHVQLGGGALNTTFGVKGFVGTNNTGAPDALFATERYTASTAPLSYAFDVADGDYLVNLYFAEVWDEAQSIGARVFDVALEGETVLDDFDITEAFGWNTAGVESLAVEVTDGVLNLDLLKGVENPKISAIEIRAADGSGADPTPNPEPTPMPIGKATLVVTPTGTIQTSNYNKNSFQITNTGDKAIASVTLDVSKALYPDSVFDPFGLAGDSVKKALTVDTAGGTGVKAPNSASYIGAGGTAGYEKIKLVFDPKSSGGFTQGETLGFSIDMDPNSVAGSTKATLDAGTSPKWDVGGVSGAELIGSRFTVTFADGTTATGQLGSMGNPVGSHALATQAARAEPMTLKANGLGAGSVGEYGEGGPTVTIQGEAGQTARVVLTKGFIQPVENKFTGAYKAQLDAQLAELAAAGFPANNAVEFQTVDVALTGKVQNISSLFDFDSVAGVTLASEDDLPLGLVASVINGKGAPKGPVTAPIYLGFDEDAGSGSGGTGSHTIKVFADGEAMTSTSGGLIKPRFNLIVDGKTVGTKTVTNADAQAFDRDFDSFAFNFEGSTPQTVAIQFFNDRGRSPYGPGDDVNLFIDRIEVDGVVFQAEKDGFVTADNRAHAQWDGAREDMNVNSVMLFNELNLA